MGILTVIGNLLGIGKNLLENKQKLKQLKQEQEFAIIEAETKAVVDRIMNNTQSDNEIDLITARNKRYTSKDEILSYLFLVPVVIATVTPFIVAFKYGDWANLNHFVKSSYESLDQLPDWYKWILAAITIDILGFRSFTRKVVDKFIEARFKNKKDGRSDNEGS